MGVIHDKELRIADFRTATFGIIELFHGGEMLMGREENLLIDTIHELQMGYTQWLTRQPLKQQTFPPDGEI